MFYYSKCSEYKKDLRNIQIELEKLRNLTKTKENEWQLEKSALEVNYYICNIIFMWNILSHTHNLRYEFKKLYLSNFRVKFVMVKYQIKLL